MFKSKRVKELEKLLEQKEKRINLLLEDIKYQDKKRDELRAQLDTCTKLKDNIPSDCKPGSLCAACEFAKEIHIGTGWGIQKRHICNKAELCSNFVQKEAYK